MPAMFIHYTQNCQKSFQPDIYDCITKNFRDVVVLFNFPCIEVARHKLIVSRALTSWQACAGRASERERERMSDVAERGDEINPLPLRFYTMLKYFLMTCFTFLDVSYLKITTIEWLSRLFGPFNNFISQYICFFFTIEPTEQRSQVQLKMGRESTGYAAATHICNRAMQTHPRILLLSSSSSSSKLKKYFTYANPIAMHATVLDEMNFILTIIAFQLNRTLI